MDRHYTRAGIDPNGGVNSPDEFDKLSDDEKQLLMKQISAIIEPADKPLNRDTYRLKHMLGMYVNNGAFKGACLALGFRVADKTMLNWRLYARMKQRKTARQRSHKCV